MTYEFKPEDCPRRLPNGEHRFEITDLGPNVPEFLICKSCGVRSESMFTGGHLAGGE